MPAKPKMEYQLVCAKFKQRGHSTHRYTLPKDPKVRAQKIIDANHHSSMLAARSAHRSAYYSNEAPWSVQEREVGTWKDSA